MSVFNFKDTLILAPTFHVYEKYCDALIELLNENWPGHPDVYFFSDKRSNNKVKYKKIIRSDRSQWPFVVLNGCKEIKNKYPEVSKILLLNEEGFPLYKIDDVKLLEMLNISYNYSKKYIYFPCYDNNWKFSEEIQGQYFCSTPKNYQYYTQLGPAFWDINYLINTCEYAIANDILSPWKFELIVTEEEHLISDYKWPTVADGLFKDGFVNKNALKLLSNKRSQLRRQLQLTVFKEKPVQMYRFLLRKIIGGTNRIFSVIKIKPLVYPYRS